MAGFQQTHSALSGDKWCANIANNTPCYNECCSQVADNAHYYTNGVSPYPPSSEYLNYMVSTAMVPAHSQSQFDAGISYNTWQPAVVQIPLDSTESTTYQPMHGRDYFCGGSKTQRSRAEKQLMEQMGFLPCKCGEPFRGKYARSNLTRHIREQTRDPIPCGLCNYKTPRHDNLLSHYSNVHPDEACRHCGEIPVPKSSGPHKFVCTSCGLVFDTPDDLYFHMEKKHR